MVALEKITDTRFADVYEEFLKDDDPTVPASGWQRLFRANEGQTEDHFGYCLTDGRKIIGMLGMIFSSRMIDAQPKRFCNLHSWIVHPDYRGHSLMLMRPALRLRAHTLTDFTPTDPVCAISKKLGFKMLDARLRVLLPIRSRLKSSNVEVYTEPTDLTRFMTKDEACLARDHQDSNHLVASDGSRHCYVIFDRNERYAFPYCQVLHISDPAIFEEWQGVLRPILLSIANARFIAVDDRLIKGCRFRRSFGLPIASQQLYRSDDLDPTQIDALYSEVSFLKLTTFPNTSYFLSRYARALNPFSRKREND